MIAEIDAEFTITRVEEPVQWIPCWILKETRLGVIRQLISEESPDKRAKLEAIRDDIERLIMSV